MAIEDLPETEHNPCVGNLVSHDYRDPSRNERIPVVERAEIKYVNGAYQILFIGGRCKGSTTLVGSPRAFEEEGKMYLAGTDDCSVHMSNILEYRRLSYRIEFV